MVLAPDMTYSRVASPPRSIPDQSLWRSSRSESVLTQRIAFLDIQHKTAIWIRNVERTMLLAKGAIADTRSIFLGWNGRGKAKGAPARNNDCPPGASNRPLSSARPRNLLGTRNDFQTRRFEVHDIAICSEIVHGHTSRGESLFKTRPHLLAI